LAQTAWGLEKMKCHQIGHKNPHFLSHRWWNWLWEDWSFFRW
jgi:hypothetical protein